MKRVFNYRAFRLAQSGVSLIILAAILVLGTAGVLLGALNAATSNTTATKRDASGRALAEAKQALLGYAATKAATDTYPGRLPCPEAPGYYGDAANEGIASGFCTLPAVGRLPWRTLGLSKLTDGYGEPLWYVVSPGFALPSSTASVSINSNTPAQLTVDGTSAAAVALIIAPGPPMNVQSASDCAPRAQSRAASLPDSRDYLECENASTESPPGPYKFATTGPSTSFNDQVVMITHAELFGAVEPVVAKRIEKEIVPALKTVYTPSNWGFSGTNPVYPFPAVFANPGPGAGTSNFQGAAANYNGLLPFNQTQGCTPAAADPRCTTTFLVFSKSGNDTKTGSGSIRTQSTCSWQSDVYVCTGEYNAPSISLTFRLNVTNVAMGLRALDLTKVTCTAVDDVGAGDPIKNVACSVTGVALQTNGSAILTVATSALPDIASSGWGTYANYTIRIDRAAIGDHALLSVSSSTTDWFVRNEWYRLVYYAVAQGHTATSLPSAPACTTGSTCLSVTNVTPSSAQRAILIFAGRALGAHARPSSNPSDYFEDPENYNGNRVYVKPTISKTTNDRVIVVDANP